MPMAPDPAISSERGSAGGNMASKYVQMLWPSGSMPGRTRGRAPVAMMICAAV